MDHKGPSPKINSKKRATAAEQVTKQHEEYEARGQPSSDRMVNVQTHNEKYPKLREQINRRRSVADVSDIDKARMLRTSRSHKRSGQAKRRRRDKNLTRVTKKRSNNCSCSKIFSTKSSISNRIAVKLISRRIGTEDLTLADAPVAPTVVSKTKKENDIKPAGSPPSSIGSRLTSVSSLNSYYSMDQEPMGR